MQNREYTEIAAGTPYRVSTQAAFWRVQTLRDLIAPGESAWQFEIHGSIRSARTAGFAEMKNDVLGYRHHVVERGKWFPWAYRKFVRMGIGIEPTAREVMSWAEAARWLLKKGLAPIYRSMPPKIRQAYQRVMR